MAKNSFILKNMKPNSLTEQESEILTRIKRYSTIIRQATIVQGRSDVPK